jgi:hypothetical protein
MRLSPGLVRRPAYICYGPCAENTENIRVYRGGNLKLGANAWGQSAVGNIGNSIRYETYGPLITCPRVWINWVSGVKDFESSHRSGQLMPNPGLNFDTMPYSQSVGYTDGSVRHFTDNAGGYCDPLQ